MNIAGISSCELAELKNLWLFVLRDGWGLLVAQGLVRFSCLRIGDFLKSPFSVSGPWDRMVNSYHQMALAKVPSL